MECAYFQIPLASQYMSCLTVSNFSSTIDFSKYLLILNYMRGTHFKQVGTRGNTRPLWNTLNTPVCTSPQVSLQLTGNRWHNHDRDRGILDRRRGSQGSPLCDTHDHIKDCVLFLFMLYTVSWIFWNPGCIHHLSFSFWSLEKPSVPHLKKKKKKNFT